MKALYVFENGECNHNGPKTKHELWGALQLTYSGHPKYSDNEQMIVVFTVRLNKNKVTVSMTLSSNYLAYHGRPENNFVNHCPGRNLNFQ